MANLLPSAGCDLKVVALVHASVLIPLIDSPFPWIVFMNRGAQFPVSVSPRLHTDAGPSRLKPAETLHNLIVFHADQNRHLVS